MTIQEPGFDLDATLLALADPTRRAILQRLSAGEVRMTDLARPFAISLNAVSKHVRLLERARLVNRRRAGRNHFLTIDPGPVEAASHWIATQSAFWRARLDTLDRLLKAEGPLSDPPFYERKPTMSETAANLVQVKVSRRFEASAERVFDAWLDPGTAGRWLFATETGEMVRVEIDPVVGGSFVIVERRDGEEIEHKGEYLEIERPRRLVFTFGVPKYSELMTRVTVEIEPVENGSELTLTHDGVLPDYESRNQEGWTMILNSLASTLDQA